MAEHARHCDVNLLGVDYGCSCGKDTEDLIATLTRERDEERKQFADERLANQANYKVNAEIFAERDAALAQLKSATLTGIRAGLEAGATTAGSFTLDIQSKSSLRDHDNDLIADIEHEIRAIDPKAILDKLTKTEGAK